MEKHVFKFSLLENDSKLLFAENHEARSALQFCQRHKYTISWQYLKIRNWQCLKTTKKQKLFYVSTIDINLMWNFRSFSKYFEYAHWYYLLNTKMITILINENFNMRMWVRWSNKIYNEIDKATEWKLCK